jgi:hypothetical protein
VTLATPGSFINAFLIVTGQVGQVIPGTAKVTDLGAAQSGEERANRKVAIAPCSSFIEVLSKARD